jgi:hypothetical protein
MGRERTFHGLQSFIRTYHGNRDHPVLEDFLELMRPFAADRSGFDEFTRQWFLEVVLPEYRLLDPKKTREGSGWNVTVVLDNAGSGAMPVQVAAFRGARFDKSGKASPDYQEARVTTMLGKGQSRALTIHCPFDPESLIVDPDALVLQLQRKSATVKF